MAKLNTNLSTEEGTVTNGFKAPAEARVYAFANNAEDSKRLGGAFLQTPLFKYGNLSIMQGTNGNFVSYPSRKSNLTGDDGRPVYFDRYYPASKEARDFINDTILAGFNVPGQYEGKISNEYYSEDDIEVSDIKITLDGEGNPVNGVLCTVKVTTPLMVHPFITVRQSNTDQDDFYLTFPSYKTEQVDENGKAVYNRYFQPTNKEAGEYLTRIVLEAVQEELNKRQA